MNLRVLLLQTALVSKAVVATTWFKIIVATIRSKTSSVSMERPIRRSPLTTKRNVLLVYLRHCPCFWNNWPFGLFVVLSLLCPCPATLHPCRGRTDPSLDFSFTPESVLSLQHELLQSRRMRNAYIADPRWSNLLFPYALCRNIPCYRQSTQHVAEWITLSHHAPSTFHVL